jgi:putative DNA primase/helicase
MIVEGKYLQRINSDLGAELAPFELADTFMHFGENGSSNASKKPLWVCGKTWNYKGNEYFLITYGSFKGGSKFQLASYDMKEQTPQFRKAHNDQIKEIEEKARKIKEKARVDGVAKWKPKYYSCSPSSDVTHEYLGRKSIKGNHRARVDYRNTLLIPVEGLDEDLNYTFEGVQMIYRNADNNQWVKFYNTGLVKKGSFTRVVEFDVKKTEFVYLCEGFATGCTIYMATNVPTVCAFDSGNLDVVVEKLKSLNPDIKIIIAADDDFQTIINGKQFNVGISKAIACQKKFPNVTYKKPKFTYRNDETDFNDLHILEGIEVVTEQLRINRAEFTDVILLGHDDHKEFFYLCTQSKSIVSLTASQHKGEHLKAIANEKYWAEKYGWRKDKDGNMYPNWNLISDKLLEKQRDLGQFDYKLVRGLGVWEDEGRVLVNFGQGVYDAKTRETKSNIDPHLKSKNFYDASTGDHINFDDELTDDEAIIVGEAIRALNFKNDHDYVFVMGFLAIANVFGALSWRPHLWVTAPAGSGKSWIIKKLRELVYFHIAFRKAPSVAGVEQNVGSHAKLVVIDEAEASERVDAIVEIARQSSTLGAGLNGKGTTNGKGMLTEMNACFMMASIQPPHFTEKADESRFFIVDMNSNENQTMEEFSEIENKFKAIEGMGQRLMVRMVNNIETLHQNIEVAKRVLRSLKVSAREADQLAPIIAGFVMFFSKQKISDDVVINVINKMGLSKSDYVERNEEKQDERVYTALMMLQLNNHGLTVAEGLKASIEANRTHSDLQSHGMLWVEKHNALFIAANAPLLDRKMKGFNQHNFRKVLERSPNFMKKNVVQRVSWAASGMAKGFYLKVNVLP